MIFTPSAYRKKNRSPLTRFVISIVAVTFVLQYTLAPILAVYAETPPDTTPPVVTVSAPVNGVSVGQSVQIEATASDDIGVVGVQFVIDGTLFGAEVVAAPYRAAWDTTALSDGTTHTLIATARDAAGNVTSAPEVTVTIDNAAPTITVTNPSANAVVSKKVTLTADAADNLGVAAVQFVVDGTPVGVELLAPPFRVEWNTSLVANGNHAVRATARDDAGNTAASTDVTVTVNNLPPVPDTTPPTVSIANPPAETVVALSVTLSVKLTDNIGVVGVQYKLDGLPIGPEITDAPFSYEWDSSTVPNGAHVLSAEARDAAGNHTISGNVDIVCNNADISNSNSAEIHNTVGADANTGGNSAIGDYDPATNSGGVPTPSLITSGDATAGNILNTQANTNVTGIVASGPINVSIRNDNDATITNDVSARAETGGNTTNANRFSEMASGDANIFTAVMNMVNTTVVGSNFTTLVRDIFDTFIGDIDLVSAILNIFSGGMGEGTMDIHNTSTGSITNNVNVNASTGSNTANNNRQSHIATGDINVATNVVNLLNTNIVGANWLFSSINVWGQFIGDIILPGEGVLESLFGTPTTQLTVENNNTAGIVNTVAVNANTGNNNSVDNREAYIQTGDVHAQTQAINTVNTNIVNANFFGFTPNILGSWTGHEVDPWSGSLPNTQLDTSLDPNYTNSLGVDINNTARISNTITVNADTGSNSTNGNRYSSINTGDIRAATNLVNVANTNIVGSNWFLGNLNLFGSWQGNITYAYPDLTLGLQVPADAHPGDTVTTTLSFRNQGRVPGQAVTLIDHVPANATFVSASDGGTYADGVVTWQLGRLGALSTPQTVNVVVQMPASLPYGDTLFTHNAVISTLTPEPQKTNNSISGLTRIHLDPPPPPPPPVPVVQQATAFVPVPALSLVKTNNASGALHPGSQVTYTIDLTNTGNVPVSDVLIHDQLPDATGTPLFSKDFPLDSLAVGATMNVSYTLTVSADTPPGTYTNTATATAKFGATVVSASAAHSSVQIVAAPKTSTPPILPTPAKKGDSLAVSQQLKTTLKTFQAGDKLNFRITVTNTGSGALKNVVLTNKFVNGNKHVVKWNLGTLKKGVGLALTYVLSLATDIRPGAYLSQVYAEGISAQGKKVVSKVSGMSFKVKGVVTAAKNAVQKIAAKTQSVKKSALKGTMNRTAVGGYTFFDEQGKPITAWQYVNLNSLSMVDLLRDSKDATDRAFVQAYESGLTLVGKPGKNGIISLQDVIKDLRSAPQFRTLYGDAFALAANH